MQRLKGKSSHGFDGVFANASTLEECREELREVIEKSSAIDHGSVSIDHAEAMSLEWFPGVSRVQVEAVLRACRAEPRKKPSPPLGGGGS